MRFFKFLFVAIFVFSKVAYAHPHVFINVEAEIVFEKGKFKGVKQKWIFDEMFSSDLIITHDANEDGEFSEDEIKTLKEEAFNNLKEYNYFNHVYFDKKEALFEKEENFKATIINKEIVSYEFFLPNMIDIENTKNFVFSINDPEFFIAYEYKDNKINFAGKKCSFDIKEDKDRPIYMDMVFPLSFFVKCED